MDTTPAALVDYSSSVSYGDLPQSSIDACKVRVLDSLGCIAAAYDHPVSVSARTLARSYTTPELGGNRTRIKSEGRPGNGCIRQWGNAATTRYQRYVSREERRSSK